MKVLLNLLSKLKLQHYLIAAVIVLIILLNYSMGRTEAQRKEKIREQNNYEALRDKDSLKIAVLQFSTTRQLRDYIATIEELNNMVKAQNIKIKNINSIVYQQLVYKDTTKTTTDVSDVAVAVKLDVPITKQWVDSTYCLTVKGTIKYKDSVLSVNITDRVFRNSITIIGGMRRTQWSFLGIKTRFLGKWETDVTASSTCGEAKTTIIKRTE